MGSALASQIKGPLFALPRKRSLSRLSALNAELTQAKIILKNN